MKRSGYSTRKRPRPTPGVSLFPFLAVLICTMGALILLLVVIARQARLQAAQAVAAKEIEQQEDNESELETLQWEVEQLEESRRKTEGDLAGARMVLGHIEDHTRRLSDELAQLKAAFEALQQPELEEGRRSEQLAAELDRLKDEIARTERELAQSEQAIAQRRRSYAIVPYQGPNETFRRPIYIECRADSVVIQPEGIELGEDDFLGPMGPGNPLAAALRATREYLLGSGQFDPEQAGEPYPLLLVRPDGVVAYYAVRAAMKSWGSEFGYELIGEDWDLDFPPPDARLADVTQRAIETARVRQMRLIAAAPRHYQGSRKPRYRVMTRGIAEDREMEYSGNRGSPYRRQPTAGRVGRQFGSKEPRSPLRSHGNGQKTAANQSNMRPPRESAQSGGTPQRPGEWTPHEKKPSQGSGEKHAEKLAATRGQDWGLPDASRGSTPLTRPIRVECLPDRLIVGPQQDGTGKTILLREHTGDSIDDFISAVWEHMDRWGIAGKGMYWKPVLNLYVAPEAESRFTDLEILLDDSGLSVERKQ